MPPLLAAVSMVLTGACSDAPPPSVASDVDVGDGTSEADRPAAAAEEPIDAGASRPTVPPAPPTTAIGDERPHTDPAEPEGGPAPELEELLARRYEAFWDAFDAARRAPTVDPSQDFPLLGELAAGEQLDVSYRTVIELAESGEAIREPDTPAVDGVDADAEHRVRVDVIDGTIAELSGCVVNDDVRHIVASGAVVRESVTTVLSEATMALADGQWKLIRSRAVDIAPGVTGCWLSDDAEFPY